MKRTFAPFKIRNYRLFFIGQLVSLIGTFMQQTASAWLVLTISHSGTMLGLVVAAQLLPVLLLGPFGGVIVDRSNKRRLFVITQSGLGIVSLVMGVLVITDTITLGMIIALALIFGVINAAANPARQAFIPELVEKNYLRRAISLNSLIMNSSRAVGPAIAAVLIATVGIEFCFMADAASYIIVIAAVVMMRASELHVSTPAKREKGQIRAGFRYVRKVPALVVPLGMMVLIGTLAYEFQVVLPLLAKDTFHGDASTLGTLTAAQGIGAILGGLYVARHGHTGIKAVTLGAAAFGTALVIAALAPTLQLELIAMFLVGAASVQFLSVGASTIQLTADSNYRGRVMALWTMAFLGSTPIGGPIVGWVSENFTPRLGLGLGAMACFGGAAIGFAAFRKIRNVEANITSIQPTELEAASA